MEVHMKSGGTTSLSSCWTGDFFISKKEELSMGRLIAKEFRNFRWSLAGCLLYLGFAAPAFSEFYNEENLDDLVRKD